MALTARFLNSLVLIFTICAFVQSSAFAKRLLIDRKEVSVNAALITLSDLVSFRKTLPLRSQIDPLFSGTTIATKNQSSSDEEIVQFMISEQLMAQAFPTKDEEVEQEINGIQTSNHFDRNQLKQALKEQGFHFANYYELIRASISKRTLIDREIRTKVYISDDDVKNYFFNQKDFASAIKTYKIQILEFPLADYISPQAAHDQARKALDSLRSGETFEEVSKRYAGSDLGYLPEEELSANLRTLVKKMKVGEVSDIQKMNPKMLGVIKLADIKSNQDQKLKQMEADIRAKLASTEYQRQINFWIERQKQNASIHLAPPKQ